MARQINLLLMLLAGALAVPAQKVYDCGNEWEKTCGFGDWERYNMQYWTEHSCDADLKPENGRCVNENRHTKTYTGGWLGWALAEQRYQISKDQPINRVPWLGAHNAFSNLAQGFSGYIYVNQKYSITDLLNLGARHLEIDPHYYGGAGRDAVRLCHASSTTLCRVPEYSTRLFGYAMKEIADWLHAHPGEVVAIKLDDGDIDNDTKKQAMYFDIATYLGFYVYPPVGNFTRWPTMQEIRAAGKQAIVMSHNQTPLSNNGWVWNNQPYVLADNHPISQDFVYCRSSDGVLQTDRTRNAWWDTAEGRSGSNLLDTLPGFDLDKLTGWFQEYEVTAATRCGVSIIGLDFLGALDDSHNIVRRASPPDDRVHASIWSWNDNDYGQNGLALLKGNDQRWHSTNVGEQHQLACAPVRAYADANDDRGWKITSQVYSWNLAIGNSACASEFNSPGVQYEFAFPRNGFQNARLAELAGATGKVWLAYSTQPSSLLAVDPGQFSFTLTPGGSLPPAAQVTLYGPAGGVVDTDSTVGWLNRPSTTGQVLPPTAAFSFPVSLNSQALSLAPGEYSGAVTFRVTTTHGVLGPISANVKLTVKGPSQTTLTTPVNPITFGSRVTVEVMVSGNAGGLPHGTITLTEVSAPDPVVATYTQTTSGETNKFDFNGVATGAHTFAASYSGDDRYLPSDSPKLTVMVIPRISANPSQITYSMLAGGPLPAAQSVTLGRFSPGLRVDSGPGCGFVQASVNAAQSRLDGPLAAAALGLAVGSYTCNLTVRDNDSATGGSTVVPVMLNVQTTLITEPTSLSFLASVEHPFADATAYTPGNLNIPVTYQSNATWLNVASNTFFTPTPLAIAPDVTGLAPGVYNGRVTAASDLAIAPAYIDVRLTVVGRTVIDSVPAGRQVFVDNSPVTTPAAFTWAPGTQHSLSSNTLQGDASTRYRFAGWSNGGAQTQTVAAQLQGATYVAQVNPEYHLQTLVAPTGTGTIGVTPMNSDGFYVAGASVQVTETPASGYNFVGWSGDLSGTTPPQTLIMSAPRSVSATFSQVVPVAITLQSDAPGTRITIDGAPRDLPAVVNMIPGQRYTLAAPALVTQGSDIQWAFQTWEPIFGGNAVNFTPTSTPVTLKVRYQKQVLVTVAASPTAGGTVSGGGWYIAVGSTPIQAIPNAGYAFTGFSGALTGTTNPQNLPLSAPASIVANFAPTGSPNLWATTTGTRTDGPQPGQRLVPVTVSNRGPGVAGTVRITGITGVTVISGSGTVTPLTPLPVDLGTLVVNGSATTTLLFGWPATASRVQFTLQLSANDGTYTGSSTLTLFR